MKGVIIAGALVGLLLLLQPNQRTKDIKTISKNPLGYLSTSKLGNLQKVSDDELRKMAEISLKLENDQPTTKQELLYYQNIMKKYDL